MSKYWIEDYKRLVRFLGKALGKNYEVVLHVLEPDNTSYIAEIINNHVSGRSEGAPLTNLGLEKIRQKDYKNNDSVLNYQVIVKNNKKIRGSTFYIKNYENELLGFLCINADYSSHMSVATDVLNLINVDIDYLLDEKKEASGEEVEILSTSIEDIIADVVDPVLLDSRVILSKETRIDIVRSLDEKGVFQLKGAIGKVADLLNISEPSVYRYLKEISKNEQDSK